MHKTKTKSNGGSEMKKVKMISAALIIMLSTVIFGMSGDGGQQPVAPKNEVISVSPQETPQGENKEVTDGVKENKMVTVKDQFGVDTGMTAAELEKFRDEYYQFAISKNYSSGLYTDRIFYSKINLLEYDKLKNYGIGLKKTMDICNLYDFIIRSELIIIGTYESVEISRDMNLTYPVTFKVKVNDIIANETEDSTLPEYITLKSENFTNIPYAKLKSMKDELVNKRSQYILFLSRFNFYYFKQVYNSGRSETVVTDDCFASDTYSCLGYSLREIKDDKIIVDYEQSTLDSANYINIDELKNISKKIFDINDKANFYKRSYK